jgi:hypothetical protein
MVWTERFLADCQRLLRQRHGFGEFTGSVQLHVSFIERGRLVLLCNRGRTDERGDQHGRQDEAKAADGLHE